MQRFTSSIAAILLGLAFPSATTFAQEQGARLFSLADPLHIFSSAVDQPPTDIHFCAWRGEDSTMKVLGTVRAGALFLSRSPASAASSSGDFPPDSRVPVDATNLALGTAVGPDLGFVVASGQSSELNLRLFRIDNWHASQTASDPMGVRFDGFGISLPAESARLDYASRLYNLELNLRPRITEGVPLVLGFRHLQLHEGFEAWALDPAIHSLGIRTKTNNYLYGFQIGAEPYLGGADGPLRLEGLIKGGIYGNHAAQSTYAPLLGVGVDAKRDSAAFVGELGLSVVYQFTRFCALRGGYELLWLNRVALAPEQSATTDLLIPSANVDCSATAFFHGAVASLDFLF